VSLHGDPSSFYPFFAGYADERGRGAGQGANLNLPLAHGTADAGFLDALDRGLAVIQKFDPGLVLVSLGFDASAHDPLGVLKVTDAGFGEIARRVAALKPADRPDPGRRLSVRPARPAPRHVSRQLRGDDVIAYFFDHAARA